MSYRLIFSVGLFCILLVMSVVSPVSSEETTQFEGLIEPYTFVNVGTPVEGVVKKVNVQRSAVVKKGEHLVYLESTVESAVVERARALAAVEGEIKLQQEQLAFAQRMNTRVQELFASDAISSEKKDQAATEVTQAQARLQKARENRLLARLDLQRVQALLNRRIIKSPIAGVVLERFVTSGEFVDSQPLLKLAQMDPLRVEVILPAQLLRSISPGMQAKIIPELNADQHYIATVTIVDRIIDPASGTFGVRLELPNPDYQLPGGLRCKVEFMGEQQKDTPAKDMQDCKGV